MSGYLAISTFFDLDKFQVGTYDVSPENTRFRFNFDYTSGDFGLRARLQYRLAQTVVNAQLNGGLIDLEYASAFANLWKNTLRITGGRVRIGGDYNLTYYAINDNAGVGYYGSGALVEGLEFQLRPFQALLNSAILSKAPFDLGLGIFVPIKFPTSTGVDGAWLATGDRLDFNGYANFSDLGVKLIFGYLMHNHTNLGFLTGTGFGNYLNFAEDKFNTVHLAASITKNFFGLVPGLNLGVEYNLILNDYNNSIRNHDINGTIGFTWEGLSIGVDILSKIFNTAYEEPNGTKSYEKYDDQALYVEANISYLFKFLALGYDLKPGLIVRYETAKDATGMAVPSDKFRIYPSLRLVQGRNEFRVGYIADLNLSKYSGVSPDWDGSITSGITINY